MDNTDNRWYGRIASFLAFRDNIEPSNFDELDDKKGWAYRYKVRIIGRHSGDKTILSDDNLQMANVVLPVTAGSGIGGFFSTPALSPGTLVTGYYQDVNGKQEPYIDGILINSNNDVPKTQSLGEIGGYDIFNDNYFGSNPQTASYVPDFLQLINKDVSFVDVSGILHTFNSGSLHYQPLKSRLEQHLDFYRNTALASPCKTDNSDLKGVQRIMKNLLNDIELLKRATSVNGVFDLLSDLTTKDKTLNYIVEASRDISGYVKNILDQARGWVYNEIMNRAKKHIPFLFPGEAIAFTKAQNETLNSISCFFNKIVRGLQSTFENLLTGLLDRYINSPLCGAQQLISDFLDEIMEDLMNSFENILNPLNDMLGKVNNLIFNVLDFATGILNFFKCDDDMACPIVHEINLAGVANNADGGDPATTSGFNGPQSASDGITTTDECAEQITPRGQGLGDSSAPVNWQIGVRNESI
jgi:uncharacterized protein YoxC